MERYTVKHNSKHKAGSILCSVAMLVFGVILYSVTKGENLFSLCLYVLFFILVLCDTVTTFAFKIDVYDNYLILRTVFRKREISFSEIKYIKGKEGIRKVNGGYYPTYNYIFYGEKRLFSIYYDYKPTSRFDKFVFEHTTSSMTPDNYERFFQTFCELGLMGVNANGEYIPIIRGV